jgi:hypothetical protein
VPSQTATFFSRNCVHSFSPQDELTCVCSIPSQSTVGETWMPSAREYLTARGISKPRRAGTGDCRTGVLEIVRDRDSAVRAALQRQKIAKLAGFALADHTRGQRCEALTDLEGRLRRCRDVKIRLLLIEKLSPVPLASAA